MIQLQDYLNVASKNKAKNDGFSLSEQTEQNTREAYSWAGL